MGEANTGAKTAFDRRSRGGRAAGRHLNRLNTERREIEASVLGEAGFMVFDEVAPLTFVASENWHPGVIGIVASRLKDKFHRPAIVIALENGVGKGSGRSIGCVDRAAVIAARQAGLLINGGGHKMAAGLTVAADKVEALRLSVRTRIGRQLEAEPFMPTLTLDGLAAAAALDGAFIEKLSGPRAVWDRATRSRVLLWPIANLSAPTW